MMNTAKKAYEWYQTDSEAVVIVKAPDVVEEVLSLNYSEKGLVLLALLKTGDHFDWKIELGHEIAKEQCWHKAKGSKVEVHLRKAQGTHWDSLEAATVEDSVAHKYPTSCSKGPKDWDRIADEVTKEEEKSDDVVNFFKYIYNGLNDDGKRAMVKSMVESKGTVLNTNWDQVGSNTVEVKPPAGTEWKPL
ncbi:hypothetical protein M514_07005 [Trichuris suis]|uniref:Uncharacterized protein n=1 Tax=Trichuris suis TaxID=68888 RepID=A0A085M4L4_9BILA|nr:hypothetical protein M513_07005 [Trichuris suis]KFD65189.1 hypothetical protein M514_07005 [Trichuris suis]KHJ44707.1 SGS domain protein [Trichuris suis]